MDDIAEVISSLESAVREMDEALTSEQVLEVAVDWCQSLVPGCQMAGVTLRRRRGRVESVAPSDAAVERCDALQYDLAEGPCLDAITDELAIRSGDVGTDERWPQWGPRAAEAEGIAGMLSIRLFSGTKVHGALNLYSREVDAFDSEATDVARVLSTHVSVALRAMQADEDLRIAVDSRNLIGQAQGILMERFSLQSDGAFAVLSRISQDRNLRLIDVAEHVVTRRTLPDGGGAHD
ncbi:GAF and ANTAR domain-containing protein [Miniimonas arenae]|uniref:GAF and ANTAR domain-containing protein n=1 Tax=Miniimonas arenae TaxID=676201 RepID=A0A5C5BD00_9MICO|nr:GAF and ANTAR domain-containing protein [Miniimonas arenae]TNU73726.1 GAF and ANTAR domain-containing protein [Miniimonas arenae]